MKIIRFDEIGSTNEYAKTLKSLGENFIVVAKKQTGGKGTKGRSFSSNEGGVYLTKVDFYTDFPAKNAFTIMANTAVAVCETLKGLGLQPKIKWPNDVFAGGKKICGILIENTFSGNKIASSIVGVGLNVNNPLPQDLQEIATTMKQQLCKDLSLASVEETLLRFLCAENTEESYEKHLGWLGENVTLLLGEERISARILGVDGQGNLRAETAEGERLFASAEVSLRIPENADKQRRGE